MDSHGRGVSAAAADFEVNDNSRLVLAELTHEFLQILEKTPSRLKRIRNWRVRGTAALFNAWQDMSGIPIISEL